MSDISVTSDTIHLIRKGESPHPDGEFPVTAHTILLSDPGVERMYVNGNFEPTCGKGGTVIPAVDGLGGIFSENIFGRMATVAGGDGVMGRTVPAVKLFPHDMTVPARPWIIQEVGKSPGIKERKSAEPHHGPDRNGGQNAQDSSLHLQIRPQGSDKHGNIIRSDMKWSIA